MADSARTPLWSQVESLARQVAQVPGLPFGNVLSAEQVKLLSRPRGVEAIKCTYTLLTVVRMLLAQALDADPSLRQAVSRLLAERTSAGHRPIGSVRQDAHVLSATSRARRGRGFPPPPAATPAAAQRI